MQEIERKFLLERRPAWLERHGSREIAQGYLAVGERVEVRLRRAGADLTLTVKRGRGEAREEVEVALDSDQFEALWPLTESRRLRKRRFEVPLGGGLRAEVDSYEGELEGLLVAEVEFPSAEAGHGFEPPEWLGREVTGDGRYANRELALGGGPPDPASGEA